MKIPVKIGWLLLVIVLCSKHTTGQTWNFIRATNVCGPTMPPSMCLAAYGFQIAANGRFIIGFLVSRSKQQTGFLRSYEWKQINLLASKVVVTIQDTEQLPGPILQGWSNLNTINLLKNNSTYSFYFWNGNSGNLRLQGTVNASLELHNYLDHLLEAYYPRPFPTNISFEITIR